MEGLYPISMPSRLGSRQGFVSDTSKAHSSRSAPPADGRLRASCSALAPSLYLGTMPANSKQTWILRTKHLDVCHSTGIYPDLVPWSHPTRYSPHGLLGIVDLFNQALVTKRVWRVILRTLNGTMFRLGAMHSYI